MGKYEKIQADYISALRELQPELIEWWTSLTGTTDPNDPAPPDILERWPFAYSGHPRVLAVFRKHYFLIHSLNEEASVDAAQPDPLPDEEARWGVQDGGKPYSYRRPVDLLVNDIEQEAPDLHKLVSGLVFVPVGMNQYDDPV